MLRQNHPGKLTPARIPTGFRVQVLPWERGRAFLCCNNHHTFSHPQRGERQERQRLAARQRERAKQDPHGERRKSLLSPYFFQQISRELRGFAPHSLKLFGSLPIVLFGRRPGASVGLTDLSDSEEVNHTNAIRRLGSVLSFPVGVFSLSGDVPRTFPLLIRETTSSRWPSEQV